MITERQNYIGGSDAAAIIGLSKWKTPYEVWLEKTGQGIEKPETLPMKLGTMMEGIVADLWASQYNKKIKKSNKTLFSKDYPFIGANLDRLIVGEKSFLEVKTTWFNKDWEDEKIPLQYLIQCLHYLYVTQYEYCYLVVLICNSELRSYKIFKKDYEKQIEQIIAKEVEFWQKYVVPKIPPPVSASANDSEAIFQQFSSEIKEPTQELDLSGDDEVQLLLENLESYKQDRKKLDEQITQIENQIKLKLGEYQIAKTSRYIIEWKVQERSTIDKQKLIEDGIDISKYEKKTISRVFKLKQIKEEK